jgi:hypothetical protein
MSFADHLDLSGFVVSEDISYTHIIIIIVVVAVAVIIIIIMNIEMMFFHSVSVRFSP